MSSSSGKGFASEDAATPTFNLPVYLIMCLLGLGLLLPWNIALNSFPYLETLYEKSLSSKLSFYLTLAYTYPGLPFLLLMVKWGSKFSPELRILGSILLEAVCLVIIPFTAKYSVWSPLVLLFVIGICTIILQSSLFGFSSKFPIIYNQGLMGGQGFAGIIASISQIIVLLSSTKNSGDSPSQGSSTGLFLFAAGVMVLCAVSFRVLLSLPVTKQFLTSAPTVSDSDVEELTVASYQDDNENQASLLISQREKAAPPSVLSVLKKSWKMCISVHLVFVITFMVFPSVLEIIAYKGDIGEKLNFPILGQNNNMWWTTILLAVFNVCDTFGRMLPAKLILLTEGTLLPAVLLRVAFIPLMLACAHTWTPDFNDVASVLVVGFFGMTNGYMASLAFMWAPIHLEDNEREISGFIMSFCLNIGIVLGSNIALAFS